MIVIIEAGLFKRLRLILRDHAERHASFKAKATYFADQLNHFFDIAIFEFAPRRTHAKPRRAG